MQKTQVLQMKINMKNAHKSQNECCMYEISMCNNIEM